MIFLIAFVIAFLVTINLWLLASRRRRIVVIHSDKQTTGR